MPAYSEQELIAGCQNNDRNMQRDLYQQYFGTFMKVCARYARDMHDAEQLLNDGFLSIFTHISHYEGKGSFEGWMRRIMVNTCLDYLRSKYLKNARQTALNPDLIEATAPVTGNLALSNLSFRELTALIQSLPAMTRTVFNLFVFEGFNHKEIAGMLDISEGTSSWHVHQGRKLLQQKIKALEKTAV
jgi:RNA polymerase sigma factor (sigma-70 family)